MIKRIKQLLGCVMFLVGIIFLRYEVKVPSLKEMKEISGIVEQYRCEGLSKYGDTLAIKLHLHDNWLFVQGVTLSCHDIEVQLRESKFSVTVWADISGVDPIVRAFQIDEHKYLSSQLGYSGKRLNIFSVIALCVGASLLFLPLPSNRGV